MIPSELTGAWQRISLAIGDGPASEPADVLWLQAGRWFADLRIPRPGTDHPVMSFAGDIVHRLEPGDEHPDRLTWRHQIDLDHGDADEGTVWWEGDDLVETGSFTMRGDEISYREVWRRLPGPDGPTSAHRCEGGMLVRVGDHALTVVDGRPVEGFSAARWRDDGGRWNIVGSFGEGAATLPAPGPSGGFEAGGLRWEPLDA